VIFTPTLAPAASDLSSAAGIIAERLAAELPTGQEGSGRIVYFVPPVGLVAKFDRSGAHPDREYLLMREPEGPKAGLPLVIGAARVTAVREEQARGVLLWSDDTPRPGDLLAPPSRVTIFLAPAYDLARHPEASPGLVDQAFELALSQQPRLRVVRTKGQPDPAELASQLKTTGEIGLLVEPLLLPDRGTIKLAAKVRSIFAGHTTATYAEALALAPLMAQPAPAPSTAPSAKLAPPPEKPEKKREAEAAPPGFVIAKKEAEPGEIVLEKTKTGPVRSDVTEKLIAITAGDLDGDGRPELVGITPNGLFAYRWTDRGFAQQAEYLDREQFVQYLAVDTADINGNGRDEIFVTAIFSVPAGLELRNRLQSLVLELDGRTLKPIASNLPYFFRAARIPGQKQPLLLAQQMGKHDPFTGPILKMAWKGNRYVEDGRLPLPGKETWLYDFAILELGERGATALASVDGKGHLLVSRDGKMIWEGKENLGPVDHAGFLQTPRFPYLPETLSEMTQPRPEQIAERRVLARKILTAPPLLGGGNLELVTVANRVHYGFQFRLEGEPAGAASVVGYLDSGDKFEKNWETAPVEGVARDVALADFDADGRRDVVLLLAIEDRAALNLFLVRPGKGA
jgi:hypothetical protein